MDQLDENSTSFSVDNFYVVCYFKNMHSQVAIIQCKQHRSAIIKCVAADVTGSLDYCEEMVYLL